ncbi:hypothetical protein HK100_000985 [Physocladia obscura]|uniref:Uncharacterized protein n=1 Tax=Physocladia obscura TaxID=109957 RepID=A0AAD5SXH2_9FUNG|nr:hypothetical protein HK100_000985 [Physocladia obscura]
MNQTPDYELDSASYETSIDILQLQLEQQVNSNIVEMADLPDTSPNRSLSPANNSPQHLPTPPPDYQGRELFELSLIAEIKIDFNKPPREYFSTVLPSRLEDRISNMTFASRITSLNNRLTAPEMQRSIWFASNYTNGSAFIGLFSAFVGFVVYYITKNPAWLGLLAVGLLAIVAFPSTPKVD